MAAQNADKRRREICDIAIELLAQEGIRGLTHLKVDRRAGFPQGTTSFYFRTRAALVHAAAARLADLDRRDLSRAMRPQEFAGRPSVLARLVIRSAKGVHLVRARARYELALEGSRDPDLARATAEATAQFRQLIRDAVHRHYRTDDFDETQVDEVSHLITTYLNGVLFGYVQGDRAVSSAEHLDRILYGISAGLNAVTADPST